MDSGSCVLACSVRTLQDGSVVTVGVKCLRHSWRQMPSFSFASHSWSPCAWLMLASSRALLVSYIECLRPFNTQSVPFSCACLVHRWWSMTSSLSCPSPLQDARRDVSHTVDDGHALPHVILRLDLVKLSFRECALSQEKSRLSVTSKRHFVSGPRQRGFTVSCLARDQHSKRGSGSSDSVHCQRVRLWRSPSSSGWRLLCEAAPYDRD